MTERGKDRTDHHQLVGALDVTWRRERVGQMPRFSSAGSPADVLPPQPPHPSATWGQGG